MAVLSYLTEAVFKLEIFDAKEKKWRTAFFFDKGINDDHFLPYSNTNEFFRINAAVCILPKNPDDITLSWKAIEYLKSNNIACIYLIDSSVQYDFSNSDAFTHARKRIEEVTVHSRSLFDQRLFLHTLKEVTAIVGIFFVPCIMFYKIVALFAK